MSRARRQRDLAPGVSDTAWAMMTDKPLPLVAKGSPEDWERYGLRQRGARLPNGKPTLAGLWAIHGTAIIEAWAEEYPGTRPSCWWKWDAPRQPEGTHAGAYYEGQIPEPRRRLGGTGTPAHEVLAHVPAFHLGLPVRWVTREEAEYYAARTAPFDGVPPNPNDPPLFESEAAYLDRHGLLLPGERRRLKAADFELETLTPDWWS